jgi:DNA-nicking Smr family endonuclease
MTRRRDRGRPPLSRTDALLDVEPTGTLDLHGYRASEAEAAVGTFLRSWAKRQPGAVLHVITGKGRGSAGRPALKPLVRRLLGTTLAPLVAEWSPDLDDAGYRVRLP